MKRYLVILIGIFLISFVSAVPSPHAFYGEVNYSNNESVEEGTIIATISESVVASANIIDGTYDLVVASEYGGLIYFYLEGLEESLANYIFDSFEITELDFEIPIPESPEEEEPEEPEPEEDNDEDESHSHTSNIEHPCEPSWKCGEWDSCKGGVKHRDCYDANHCDWSYNKPNEVTGCEIIEKALVEEKGNSVLLFGGLFVIVLMGILIGILARR